MSETETTGTYLNLAENHAGEFHLRRDDRAVYVSLGTARSPVQYFARERPKELFTIPEGFRPATNVTWDVTARHVQSDGTLHPTRSDPHAFRMSVDTEGRVRYVDDPGVEGVGYLRYHTALAWPLAGTDPLVCERGREIKERILAVLVDLEHGVLSCDQVDWDHLAHIRTWSSQEPITIQHANERPVVWRALPESVSREAQGEQYRYQDRYLWPPFPYWKTDLPLPREYGVVQPHDLLGLTNLTELHVKVASASPFPPGLLVHTPRLLALSVAQYDTWGWSDLPSVPRDFLAYTPHLRHLSLGKFSDALLLDWTEDALAHTPHLTSLHLGLRRPTDNFFALLQHAPQLTRLTLDGLTEPLPGTSLAHLSHLTHLTVEGGFNPCEAPALKLPVSLTDFALRLVVDGSQVACLDDSLADHWLTHAPTLTSLSVDLYGLANLDTDVLPSWPALTRLTLDVAGVTSLPPRLLADLPHLTHLQLHGSSGEWTWTDPPLELPAELLAGSPHLIELSLDVPLLHHVPVDLLAHVPNLQRLYLNVPSLKSLPNGFMGNMPQLTDVIIYPRVPDFRPDDFLVHTPQLRSLYLDTSIQFLPEEFLSHTPKLTHLWLALWGLETLPPSFLAHVPQLQHLELDPSFGSQSRVVYPLRSLPKHFLANAPSLTYLDLRPFVHLSDLPMDFLARSSKLRHLYLDAQGVSVVPDSFLTQTQHLRSLELDLRQVDALPDGFLAYVPWLRHLKIGADQIETIPADMLSYAPSLVDLYMTATNAGNLPEGFLAQSPRIRALGLGMPNLDSPPGPGDALWDTLQSTSSVVMVTQSGVPVFPNDDHFCNTNHEVNKDDVLEVFRRDLDSEGNILLYVFGWGSPLRRNQFVYSPTIYGCYFKIDVRYTEPFLDF